MEMPYTIFYRAYGWYHNGQVRWQGPARPLTYNTTFERWSQLRCVEEQNRVLERVTMMNYPEIDSIDRIAIEDIKQGTY